MHFMLILLCCSLISGVSVGAKGRGKRGKNDQQVNTKKVDPPELEPGQIIGVRPTDVKNTKVGSIDSAFHPAIFVAIDKTNTEVQFVSISNNFKTIYVPPHLRVNYDKYLPKETKFKVLVDAQTLRGELDLHKYSTVDRAKIRVDMIAEKKVMTQANFREMDGIIRSNEKNMEDRIMPLHFEPPNPREFSNEELGSIKEGQIILFNIFLGNAGQHSKATYLGIFVSWIGDGMLAIIPVSNTFQHRSEQLENIDNYITQDSKVIDKSGESISVNGKVDLEQYTFISFMDMKRHYPLKSTIIMEKERYATLRKTIDENIEKRRESDGTIRRFIPEVPENGGRGGYASGTKKPGSQGPSSTTTGGAPAPKGRRPGGASESH